MSKVKNPFLTPVVAVINMKGGVGKTTISGNVFREAFRTHKIKTLLIDFDAQFNLSQLLLTQVDYERLRAQGKTIFSVLEPATPDDAFTVSESDLIQINDIDDYTHKIRILRGNPKIDLRLLPGDFKLALLGLREDPATLQIPRQRFKSLIQKAKETYSLVVIDCNPSSSFTTRCAIESATHILVPVRPDKYSIQGVQMVHEYISKIPTIVSPPKMLILLNDMRNSTEAKRIETELRSNAVFGPSVLVNTIRHSGVLSARTDFTGFAIDRGTAYSHEVELILERVATEICTNMGMKV